MRVDFTVTATCRPEVLVRTLASFRDRLRGIELCEQTLYLNVDPVPDCGCCNEVERVARAFFRRVHANHPAHANFARAVRWCWLQPATEYFFHLEDDWEMLAVYDLDEMVGHLQADPTLSVVNLRAYPHYDPLDPRVCLSPGLHRAAHAQVMAKRLEHKYNPEKQLRPVTPDNPGGGKHEGFRGIQIPNEPVIRDHGRRWLDGSGWRKTRPVHWNTWERAR